MRHLFVDTFYLIALAHRRDQWRERVLTFSQSLRDYRLYTVDEVLAEFLTACSSSGARIRQQAGQVVRQALQDQQWTSNALEKARRIRHSNLAERCGVVLLADRGPSPPATAPSTGRHAHPIRRWLKAYLAGGWRGSRPTTAWAQQSPRTGGLGDLARRVAPQPQSIGLS